jgi:NodT family efflux transporter outer membrane factor (OMF) lipoprotein
VKKHVLILSACSLLPIAGCMVGPNYKTPPAVLAPSFKETPAPNSAGGWKISQPSDAKLKGTWWTMFGDTQLNQLEPQVDTANQTLKAAEANFRAARAQIGYARSYESPTISTSPSTSAVRDSAHQPYLLPSMANNGEGSMMLPLDLNYEIDLWGRVRRGVTQARAQAQEADADLENARLSLHAELAVDYFGLRSMDAQEVLLDSTIKAYGEALQLTLDRHEGGAAPLSDVAQARTQLDQARVQRTDVEVQRAQYEHAIAVLIGKAPAALAISPAPLQLQLSDLPDVPGVLPATLLERRPDIASQERRMAAANEQIGIAQAAYYPTLSLSAATGFVGTSALNWFTWPSRFWAVGPMLSETVFDGGRRRATKEISTAQYDQAVADYRQTALTAFQQVEDNLAALRILNTEAQQQQATTASAEQSLDLFQTRYAGGVDTYLQVVTWQTAALNNQRNEIDIMQRRLDASVLLIKALGGGWDRANLPKL